MAFARYKSGSHRPGPRKSRGLASVIGRFCVWTVLTTLLLGAMAGGILAWRLSKGPLPVPLVADAAAALVNASTADFSVSVEDAVISIGGAGEPSGLEFRSVKVVSSEGGLLLAAPRVKARFHLADLLVGQLQPTHIALIGASARVLRAEDGRIRFGLGTGRSMALTDPAESGEAPPARPGMDAVARIVQGFVGDTEPVPELARLTEIAVTNANLTYADAVSGRSWNTRGSDLRIIRLEDGARAEMQAAITDNLAVRTRLRVVATRLSGTRRTDMALSFGNLRPNVLAEQLVSLGWIRHIDTPIAGEFKLSLGEAGEVELFGGKIVSRDGTLPGPDGESFDYRRLALAVGFDPESDRVAINELAIDSDLLEADLSGFIEVHDAKDDEDPGVAGQLWVHGLALTEPELFAEPLKFDGGEVTANITFDPPKVALAQVRLSRGEMDLGAAGAIRKADDGWQADLRLTGRNIAIADLKSHWPLVAAQNARIWVVENLQSGMIDAMVANLRLAPSGEVLALDFRFSDLVSRYLGEMSPIERAHGRGHLNLDELYLTVDKGIVALDPERPVNIDGSKIAILDFDGEVTPADADIRAEAPISNILHLLDQEPLGLISRIGLDPDDLSGTATVNASVDFPLLNDLKISQIEVDTTADLREVRMPMMLGGNAPIVVTARQLDLAATTEAMQVDGNVAIDGVPAQVSWDELYGSGAEERRVVLSASITPELLARRNIAFPSFAGGRAPMRVSLAQSGAQAEFDLSIDLTPAELDVSALLWGKAPGQAGSLTAVGTLGDRIEVQEFALAAGALDVRGNALLNEDGRPQRINLDRLRLENRADLSVAINPNDGGAVAVDVRGAFLDVNAFIEEPGETSPHKGRAARVSFDIDRMRVTPKVSLSPAQGALERTAEGVLSATISGAVKGGASFDASYRRALDSPGDLRLSGPDAGGLLRGAGFFEGGQGGAFDFTATLGPDESTDLRGVLAIDNMTVRNALTFGSILEQGGASEAAAAVETGGLSFDQIEIPFRYSNGVIRLAPSTAKSSALALKVEGDVNEAQNTLDLFGVISPAYGVTGALDEIPLLGDILTGGEGEGILAMTFSVDGTLDNPNFSVNPLSLLTPGFLRNIFSGRSGDPSERFVEQLERGE